LGTNAVAPHSSRTAVGTWSTSEEVSTILAPGQIDVKQHPVRTGADDGSERVLPVRCRIHDLQAAQHQQLTHVSPEVLTVVDNQNPNRHPHSLVRRSCAFHGGNPTVVELWSRCSARSRAARVRVC
jgi:hypothetical protein